MDGSVLEIDEVCGSLIINGWKYVEINGVSM